MIKNMSPTAKANALHLVSTAQRLGFNPAHDDGQPAKLRYLFPAEGCSLALSIQQEGNQTFAQLSYFRDPQNWDIAPFDMMEDAPTDKLSVNHFAAIAVEHIARARN